MYFLKVKSRKTFFVNVFKVNDENGRIRSQILQSGTDPRIRIRTKMSRIRNDLPIKNPKRLQFQMRKKNVTQKWRK